MCTFHGSFSSKKIIEMVDKNTDLGHYSHSLACFDGPNIVSISRNYGNALFEPHDFAPGCYYVVHQESVKSYLGFGDLDPAQTTSAIGQALLWMDGKFTINTHKYLKSLLRIDSNWPAFLMLNYLQKIYGSPKKLAGDFACLLFEGDMFFMFRSDTADLYYDNEMTVSSVPFNGAKQVSSNIVHGFEPFKKKKIFPIKGLEFQTLGSEWNPK